jgi:YggT family protein
MTIALIYIINTLASLYFWVVLIMVVLSWLINFNIINPYNPFVQTAQRFCRAATEPLLRPIRRVIPDLGGLDISPVILLVGIEVVRILLVSALLGTLFS